MQGGRAGDAVEVLGHVGEGALVCAVEAAGLLQMCLQLLQHELHGHQPGAARWPRDSDKGSRGGRVRLGVLVQPAPSLVRRPAARGMSPDFVVVAASRLWEVLLCKLSGENVVEVGSAKVSALGICHEGDAETAVVHHNVGDGRDVIP